MGEPVPKIHSTAAHSWGDRWLDRLHFTFQDQAYEPGAGRSCSISRLVMAARLALRAVWACEGGQQGSRRLPGPPATLKGMTL